MHALAVLQVLIVVAMPAVSPAPAPASGASQYFYSLDPHSGAYKFGYDTGLLQHQSFREETRTEDGGVHGSYGYVDAGVLRVTEYTADKLGYRCRETIRYLVEPNRGVFVPSPETELQAIRKDQNSPNSHPAPGKGMSQISLINEHANQNNWESKSHSHLPDLEQSTQDWSPHRTAQPARVLGKKVKGLYKDFTSEPAVGGTAAVTPWNYAHKAELSDEEILGLDPLGDQSLQQVQRQGNLRSIGGTPMWPVTEDGVRVVWQPF